MLVDSSLQQPYFSSSASFSADYPADLSDILHTELFTPPASSGAGPSGSSTATAHSNSPVSLSATSNNSRASSPQSPFQSLLTPPQPSLPSSFPDIHDGSASFYPFLEDDLKGVDAMSYDFLGSFGNGLDMGLASSSVDMMNLGLPSNSASTASSSSFDSTAILGIDPQLVGTPASSRDMSEFDEDEEDQDIQDLDESPEPQTPASDRRSVPPTPKEPEQRERLTLTIAPVKVGGHGKSRKGTVQSGGIVKKSTAGTASAAATKDSELSATALTSTTSTTTVVKKGPASILKKDGEKDDDLPADWRPSPEVYQKMSSKEKRQLRNKISARNFRVRRKEYISTLEGDIAERDRLLEAIRSQLGTTENENRALRQEIAALKKILLDGRGAGESPVLNLPPPAPLPAQSAAATLLSSSSVSNATASAAPATSPANNTLLTPNTHKDLPTSPRVDAVNATSRAFWGGVGRGIGVGGITPVHTALMPEMLLNTIRAKENINPLLNSLSQQQQQQQPSTTLNGFDGFADSTSFTLKSLDAYRMHLWGRVAAQHHMAREYQQKQNLANTASSTNNLHSSPITGLAAGLRPHFFASSAASKVPILASTSSVSALLSGKHAPAMASAASSSAAAYPTPPASPSLPASSPSLTKQQQQQQHQAIAALAGQTLLKKLGSAFWDAFAGSSSSSASSPSSQAKPWDADKVRRVLEGKAVLKVVDLEPSPAPSTSVGIQTPATPAPIPAPLTLSSSSSASSLSSVTAKERGCDKCGLTDILEESMRSLSLGKKGL
ncbi:hypothetical protein AX16_009446 [Volvariella volvacea WC 439]|nr:hypothetical protein AX16_009446 [Volvariella volvacea WC 439]